MTNAFKGARTKSKPCLEHYQVFSSALGSPITANVTEAHHNPSYRPCLLESKLVNQLFQEKNRTSYHQPHVGSLITANVTKAHHTLSFRSCLLELKLVNQLFQGKNRESYHQPHVGRWGLCDNLLFFFEHYVIIYLRGRFKPLIFLQKFLVIRSIS